MESRVKEKIRLYHPGLSLWENSVTINQVRDYKEIVKLGRWMSLF